jgi:hypothetical protein
MSRTTAAAVRHRPPADEADEWVTVKEFCAEFKISRRTFDRYRANGKAPRFERLAGHGTLRARRSWITAWSGGDA